MISVIAAVYQAEEFLAECVESVLSQTLTEFELILVDDGSRDASGQICDRYARLDPRIRVIHQNNQGVSAARNAGVRSAVGEYITFIDADDFVDRDYLRVLYDLMSPGGMAACGYRICRSGAGGSTDVRGPSGTSLHGTGSRTGSTDCLTLTPDAAQISAFSVSGGIQGYVWGKMFDAGILRDNSLLFETDLRICEDLLFVIRYLPHARGDIRSTHAAPYCYRDHMGAQKRRFSAHPDFRKEELTEITALERCRDHLCPGREVEKAWQIRTIKAAVNTLRTMTANHHRDPALRQHLTGMIRQNAAACVFSPYLTGSAKASVLASSLSPELEYRLWRFLNR